MSKDFGKHLLEVDDLLQKHSLQEADITVQAERVETLNAAALKFTTIEGIVTHLTDLIRITFNIILYIIIYVNNSDCPESCRLNLCLSCLDWFIKCFLLETD